MFDIGATELLLIVIVAVLVIGPKDMPLAMRTAGRWLGKMRRVSSHFRSGIDAMIREAEMEEMEAKWKSQNEKVMREHPQDAPPEAEPTGALPSPPKQAPKVDAPEMTPVDPPAASAEQRGKTSATPTGRTGSPPAGKPADEPQLPLGKPD